MRFAVLYARSRRVVASLIGLPVGMGLIWALSRDPAEGTGPTAAALALVAGVTFVSVGLSGRDPALDRTASLPWARVRLAHLLLGGLLTGVMWLTLQAMDEELATAAFVVRDTAGLIGLTALGAVAGGARYAWAPPFTWFAVAFFTPREPDVGSQIVTWMLLPPDTEVASWSAAVLTAAGLGAYTLFGPRR
ncbi:hypothetical protein [Sinosporangium siamense]|uniref:Uncharacterized protein n=1 Tax=Sinosporangium siamense TaxID=1367973 RepID=A0A919RKH3_9ACTN|nr:hypothetical protein [Sinosporangium siamense]GII95273.1 hypothetical protein Ssi02_55040 [Sinosporangium siamense]